jgi:hypothetical protein
MISQLAKNGVDVVFCSAAIHGALSVRRHRRRSSDFADAAFAGTAFGITFECTGAMR